MPPVGFIHTTQQLLNKVDGNPMVPGAVQNGEFDATEVQFLANNVDMFQPAERDVIRLLAQQQGITLGGGEKAWLRLNKPPRLIGGIFDSATIGEDFYVTSGTHTWKYDTIADHWNTVSFYEGQRAHEKLTRQPGFGVFKDSLVMAGGTHNYRFKKTVRLHDPQTGDTMELPEMMTERARPAVTGLGERLYVFGGGNRNRTGLSTDHGDPIGDCEYYQGGSWRSLPHMPNPRTAAKAIAVGDKIFVVGGRDDDGASKDVDIFDTATNTWLPSLRMRSAHQDPSVWVEDGKVHVTGGTNAATTRSGGRNTDHDVIDPGSMTVMTAAQNRQPRLDNVPLEDSVYGAAGYVNGKLYIVGVYRSHGRERHEFTKVWDTAETKRPHQVTINNNDNRVTNVQNVLNNISVNLTSVKVDNRVTINQTNVLVDNRRIEVNLLGFVQGNNFTGFVPEQVPAEFFVRTSAGGQALLHAGPGVLAGKAASVSGKGPQGPLPKNLSGARLVLLDDRGEQVEIDGELSAPVDADERGQFAVTGLPVGFSGTALIVDPSSGDAVALPYRS